MPSNKIHAALFDLLNYTNFPKYVGFELNAMLLFCQQLINPTCYSSCHRCLLPARACLPGYAQHMSSQHIVHDDKIMTTATSNIQKTPEHQPHKAPSIESRAPDEFDHSVDFLLVWKHNPDPMIEIKNQTHRSLFEKNLAKEGIRLIETHIDGINYIKLIANDEMLVRYAEVLRLRMPMNEVLFDGSEIEFPRKSNSGLFKTFMRRQYSRSGLLTIVQRALICIRSYFQYDSRQFPQPQPRFTAVYSRDKAYLFDHTHPDFLRVSQRSRIVAFVLNRKRYQPYSTDPHAYGIGRMLALDLYVAAFPLHDGDLLTALHGRSMRWRLFEHWAALRNNWHRRQPLDDVKAYLGVQIGLHFAWVGFYTNALALAAVVGCVCFAFAVAGMPTNVPAHETCTSNRLMCPKCDRVCDYWPLHDECVLANDEAIFDSAATIVYAAFISLWAILFQTMWQRYAAEITHRWDLTGFDRHEEQPRPEFLANLAGCTRLRENYVTRTMEPAPSFWYRTLPARVFSVSVVVLLMALVLACIFGVVMYRLAVLAALQLHSPEAYRWTSITAASLNFVLILIFDMVGRYLQNLNEH